MPNRLVRLPRFRCVLLLGDGVPKSPEGDPRSVSRAIGNLFEAVRKTNFQGLSEGNGRDCLQKIKLIEEIIEGRLKERES